MDISKFCFDRLVKHPDFQIDVSLVLSEQEYINVCKEYGFSWVYADNDPLGSKINAGLKHTLKFEYDYLMMMNSDGVIKPQLLDYYKPFFEKAEPFFGVNKITYVNYGTCEAMDITYEFSVLGTGKCIRRDIIEKSGGELYRKDLNRGLDDTMMDNIIKMGYWPTIVKYDGQLVYDFKSEVNIWKWDYFKTRGECCDLKLEQVN